MSRPRFGAHRNRAIIAIIALLLLFSAASAQSTWTIEDIARMQWVNEIAISPDGQNIAYTLIVQRNPFTDEDGGAYKQLHVVTRDGITKPYVTGKLEVSKIKWLPDGSAISYLAKQDDDTVKSLHMIPLHGGESRRVIEHTTSIREFSWHPDGSRVAFLAREPKSEENERLEDMGFDQEIFEEDWQPVHVYLYKSGSNESPRRLDITGSASELHYSPSGQYLAMATAPTSLIDDKYTSRQVTVVDAATGALVHRFATLGKLGKMRWRPDSKAIAFVSGEDINDPREGELYLADVEHKTISPVVTDIDGHIDELAWVDDATVLYSMNTHVYTHFETVDVATGERSTVFTPRDTVFTSMSLCPATNTAALIGRAYNIAPEVFFYTLGNNNCTRLTNSNSWFSSMRFAPQEVVTYEARDGVELEGILIRPLDEQESQRYPLIMTVHGGPESHITNGWNTWYSYPGQAAAAQGYAVFYPNYRGSTGRGVEFSKMGQRDYAGAEFNDLVDAKAHLVEVGLVDPSKVGITGGSYGGYATAWASTALTEHFAAGVMRVGVSDMISKFGTTDIPEEMYLVHARVQPWEDWQWFLERSPIYYAGQSNTPLLIMHGEKDTRVHPGQSLELYRHLKTRGQAPVRLVLYPDEKHGTTDAAARYDTGLRIMRWMNHYLKGPGGDPPPYALDYSGLRLTGSSD